MKWFFALALCSVVACTAADSLKKNSPQAVVLEARGLCLAYETNTSIPRDPDVTEFCAAVLGECKAP
jgi:uncharacterized protein YcfL